MFARFCRLFALALAVALLLPAAAFADIPPEWAAYDVGPANGSADMVDGVWVISARGADIWNQADEFHFVNQYLTGDGSVTARIVAQTTNSDGWAKAGVMLRDTDSPGSQHLMVVMTPSNGVDMQWRPTADGGSLSSGGNQFPRLFPLFLRVQRQGDRFSAFVSPDGLDWTQIGATQRIRMGREILAGVAVTAHHTTRTCTARFDKVQVSNELVPTGPESVQALVQDSAALVLWESVPRSTGYVLYRQSPGGSGFARVNRRPIDGLSYTDPGLANGSLYRYRVTALVDGRETVPSPVTSVTPMTPIASRFFGYTIGPARPGAVSLEADGTIALRGAGWDIWGEEDGGYFLSTPVEGDATVTVRVLGSPSHTDDWAKAGVMVRETLGARARHAFLCATPRNGIAFQRRMETGKESFYDGSLPSRYPLYLRLVRRGDWIAPYVSLDGIFFEATNNAVKYDVLNRDLWIGLAITAHNDQRSCTTRFDQLTITTP
jgi:hypothetical protein